jgi:hypothetical protein
VTDATDRFESAYKELGYTQASLATALGYSSSSAIANALARGALPKKLHLFERITGVRVEWVETGLGPKFAPGRPIAHPVSPQSMSMDPQEGSQRVEWGTMKSEALPDVFRVEVPDDAMADRVLKGHLVKFDKTIAPRAGDGVLVEDAAGAWFFRQYSPGAQGRFAAVAKNSAYQTLDSERDGLTVLAVLVGVPEARWG